MKRDYTDGIQNNVNFFVGSEVEHTPAFGMTTLFVTGIQTPEHITEHTMRHQCNHIFFGANHSFNPKLGDYDDWELWTNMIAPFLKRGILCSLDIPLSHVEEFNDCHFCEYNNFIPQIRVPIPYIRSWNYNTMIKLDDRDFNNTNPGVWSHSLHSLMDREKFTDWPQYKQDKVIK